VSAAKESFSMGPSNAKYRIFNDHEADRIDSIREDHVMESHPYRVPTLDEITNFYRDVFRRAQMESDCIIMSLIYVEKLIKNTDGSLRPRPCNWRSLLFSCMILSSKVWDDLSMWNADFSQTCPSRIRFSLQRINELEVAVLNALNYKVKVPASEYAKYYFLLRSMLIKSGLGGDDIKTMSPLDVEGAKKLEQVSSSFEATAATKRRVAQEERLRSKSMGHVDTTDDKKASLEHMVEM
jgi:Cyclin, N-terminal domain